MNPIAKSINDELGEHNKYILEMLSNTGKELFMPIRIFTSHNEHGPELGKIIYIIGKEKVLGNITSFLKEM